MWMDEVLQGEEFPILYMYTAFGMQSISTIYQSTGACVDSCPEQ